MEKTNISVILQLIDENGDSVTGKTTSDIINSVTNLHGINFLNELYSILKKELNTEKSTNNSETYQVKNYYGSGYDTKLPVDLVESFAKLKEMLSELSNGKYECTPFVYDPNEAQGISTGIIEFKDNHHTKLPFYLSIR